MNHAHALAALRLCALHAPFLKTSHLLFTLLFTLFFTLLFTLLLTLVLALQRRVAWATCTPLSSVAFVCIEAVLRVG
jgi:hypothetical protein